MDDCTWETLFVEPVETYLRNMREIRATGAAVPETSYYGTLEGLFNELGKSLKPRVRCIINLANRGAGLPDGGLFTADQFQKSSDAEPLAGQAPARGVIEIKPTSDDAWVTADGPQVSRYWGKYGLVLATNYRDFVLVGKEAGGQAVKLETYRLAADEAAFWDMAAHPRQGAAAQGARFVEYLKRVMLHAAPLATPQDVAWFLASYARDAKARVESQELAALTAVRTALEEALGLKFEGDKGEHFFRSSLVQTLFYGVFSAWVLWSKQRPPTDRTVRFDWKQAVWSLHVPMIKALFHQVADPGKLEPLGLVEPLDWAAAALDRVDRAAFFATFDQAQAVQYFYEPFLEQFDPELRKQLGVWYTPLEIVQYMVARVDAVLREELDIPDGLADSRVYVLDPCCGTGAFLVEVLRRIEYIRNVEQDRGWGLAAAYAREAAIQRVFGFELMPAPFVIAHLQLGMLLQNFGAPLDEKKQERAAIYLTNALTGWLPPHGPKQHLVFPELEEERDAAERVKRDTPILVILGNPPYNAFAGVSPAEEAGLVEPYKEGLNQPVSEGGWGIKKFNLDDLYVRFFRIAERRITEGEPGRGIVCFISNFSYLGDPSFVVLRQRFVREFDALWFDCLNGDSRETGKLTPDGKPDPSVFSTADHPVGIRVGTAVGLLVRKAQRARRPAVRYRDFWGTGKRADLLDSLRRKRFDAQYQKGGPSPANRYSFRPAAVTAAYLQWPKVVELCAVAPSNGLMEKRGGALIDFNPERLAKRMKAYFNRKLDWEGYRLLGHGLTQKQARFDPKLARAKALRAERFDPSRIVRYALRPFDTRWCYYTGVRPVWNEPRPSLWAQCWKGNLFLLTRFNAAKDPEGPPFCWTPFLSDDHFLAPDAVAIPIRVKDGTRLDSEDQRNLFAAVGAEPKTERPCANLAPRAREYLRALRAGNPDADASTAALLWQHVLAIGFSPCYLADNAEGIRDDWPRVPLPDSRALLLRSAAVGRQIAALLDTSAAVMGVTSGVPRPELGLVAKLTFARGTTLNFDLIANWGYAGKDGAVMPGSGRFVERDYTAAELAAIEDGAQTLGITRDRALTQLGATTLDVYLNDTAWWQNVPAHVWEYVIGGYQVIKKWLSYRERDLLGRPLVPDETDEVTAIARRIAAILLLQPQLDRNYLAVQAATYAWPASCNDLDGGHPDSEEQ